MLVEHDLKRGTHRIVRLITRAAAVATVVVCLLNLATLHSDPESYLIGATIISSISLFALSVWTTFNSRLRNGELELQTPVGTWGFFLHGIGSGIAPVIPALMLVTVPLVFVPASIGISPTYGLSYWAISAAMAMLGTSTALLESMTLRSSSLTSGNGIIKGQIALIQLFGLMIVPFFLTFNTLLGHEFSQKTIFHQTVATIFIMILPVLAIIRVFDGHFKTTCRNAVFFSFAINIPLCIVFVIQSCGWWSDTWNWTYPASHSLLIGLLALYCANIRTSIQKGTMRRRTFEAEKRSESAPCKKDRNTMQFQESIPGKWVSIFDKEAATARNPVPGILITAILVLAVSLAGSAYIDPDLFRNPSYFLVVYMFVEVSTLTAWRSDAENVLKTDRRSGMLDLVLLAPRVDKTIVQGVFKAERELWNRKTRKFMFVIPFTLSLALICFFLLYQELGCFLASSYLIASALFFNRIRLKMFWIVTVRKSLSQSTQSILHLLEPIIFLGVANLLFSWNLLFTPTIDSISNRIGDCLILVGFFSASTLVQYIYLKYKFREALDELHSIRKLCSEEMDMRLRS